MGLCPSPYCSVQACTVAKYEVLGNPKFPSNPFAWDHIKLNLPALENYDASKPWIMKIKEDGELAAAVTRYVDNFRIVAGDQNAAWECSSRFVKNLCWLGIQDATRKRRKPSKCPGAWAGATAQSNEEVVTKGVSQERWDKVNLVACLSYRAGSGCFRLQTQ